MGYSNVSSFKLFNGGPVYYYVSTWIYRLWEYCNVFNVQVCKYDPYRDHFPRIWFGVETLVVYLIPLIFMSFIYTKIIIYIKKNAKARTNIAVRNVEMTTTKTTEDTETNIGLKRVKSKFVSLLCKRKPNLKFLKALLRRLWLWLHFLLLWRRLFLLGIWGRSICKSVLYLLGFHNYSLYSIWVRIPLFIYSQINRSKLPSESCFLLNNYSICLFYTFYLLIIYFFDILYCSLILNSINRHFLHTFYIKLS